MPNLRRGVVCPKVLSLAAQRAVIVAGARAAVNKVGEANEVSNGLPNQLGSARASIFSDGVCKRTQAAVDKPTKNLPELGCDEQRTAIIYYSEKNK